MKKQVTVSYGSATAFRGSFARSLTITEKFSDPHLYLYLLAKKENGFRYCREAVVLQNPVATIKDLKRVLKRSLGKRDEIIEKKFSEEMIRKAHYVPLRSKFIGVWKCFVWQPFYTPVAVLLSFYIGNLMSVKKSDKSPVWEIAISTKKSFTHEQ